MELTRAEAEAVKATKRLAADVADMLPAIMLKGMTRAIKGRKVKARTTIEPIDQSYNALEGEWLQWLEVARQHDYRVPVQDRFDVRHNILLELNRARQRDGQPLPVLRAHKIASLTIALYWREVNKASVRVCIYDGLPKEPHCGDCKYKPKYGVCPWVAVRPVQSLDSETTDSEGNKVRLLDTVASDKAIDMPQEWTEICFWKFRCPVRLIEIAYKKMEGKPLSAKERMYLMSYRRKEQKNLF